MSAVETSAYEWKDIPWRKLERKVFKLQTRIYRASQRGDVRTVRKLQKLLVSSWFAKCLAVRRVTQDNQGKKTAGVDGIKSLTPKERLVLLYRLSLKTKARPTRRIWIPKPGKSEKRPLGIPTLHDRAAQALVKLVLEPEWEARFEPNSYGFRPGCSCHDAMMAIQLVITKSQKWVLDADVEKCFDRIDHPALLKKLDTVPRLRRVIKGWLKAGYMDGKELFTTETGTPQGGVLSPLLANIALHGMERFLQESFPSKQRSGNERINWQPKVIRYADDLLVLHPDRSVIEQCQQLLEQWLSDIGLQLKSSKTRIAHTLKAVDAKAGFDFLGFDVRQYKAGKYNTAVIATGTIHRPLGFKTLIKPSREKTKQHYQRLSEIIDAHKSAPQEALIRRLNPVIRGWCRYYSPAVSSLVYKKLSQLMYGKLRRWANRRHPQKNRGWTYNRYWPNIPNTKRKFATRNGHTLCEHRDTPIIRHVKVQAARSPFDGDWSYWGARMGKHPGLPQKTAQLLKLQKGKCVWCDLQLRDGDVLEIDHIIPKALDGQNLLRNKQLLHRHCHDQKTTTDGSQPPKVKEVKEAERQNLRERIDEMMKDWNPYSPQKRLTEEEWRNQWC